MGLFKKKGRVIDLTEKYRKQQEQLKDIQGETNTEQNSTQNISESAGGFFGFFGNSSNENSNSDIGKIDSNETVNPDEKRRRLAKRLTDMTEKLEDLSNQIYHLQQRIEVLERKSEINRT